MGPSLEACRWTRPGLPVWALLKATGEVVVELPGPSWVRKALGVPHSPVELIVVVVDFPPEVEPGEREAEGADEEQEPQAFPLQEQNRGQCHIRQLS